jgi:predicted MFS family arabinose efflux permease
MPLLYVLAATCFISGLSSRLVDPLVPDIARDFGASASLVAMLATAYTLPNAISQPLIGALGDGLGKVRILKICLVWLVLMLLLSAAAESIGMLFLARILGGAVGGGLFPLALAMVGDRFPYNERQVAISYLLSAVLTAQLLGMISAGLIASVFSWRVVMWTVAALGLAIMAVSMAFLPASEANETKSFSVARARSGYFEVLRNRRARACYVAVFVEGCFIQGLYPYVASMLEASGSGGVREAGFVLAGVGIGGVLYTLRVATILRLLGGIFNSMRVGTAIVALSMLAVAATSAWWLQMLWFMVLGIGFYMLHGSLQAEVTEVTPTNRSTAVALHAFFFVLGQALGPIVFALLFWLIGTTASLLVAAVVLGLNGYVVTAQLTQADDEWEGGPPAPGFGHLD